MSGAPAQCWWVYFLLCKGGRLYVGISPDPVRRFGDHLAGRCAHTRLMRPEKLFSAYPAGTRTDAAKEEYRVKRLPVVEKRKIALLAESSAAWLNLRTGQTR